MAPKKNQAKAIEAEMIALVEKTVGKVQLRAFQVLSSATPVDTGFARAAWTPSVGSPVSDRLDAPTDKKAAKTKAQSMRAVNIAKAAEIAKTYKIKLGKSFLSNNVGYLEFLNRGSSGQAGAKFIERAIEQTVRSFNGTGPDVKSL